MPVPQQTRRAQSFLRPRDRGCAGAHGARLRGTQPTLRNSALTAASFSVSSCHQTADRGRGILAGRTLQAGGGLTQIQGVDVGAGPLQGMRALAHGVEVAHLERRDDFRQALIAAADEGLGQFAFELDVAAGEFAQRRRDRPRAQRSLAFKKRLKALDHLGRLDRFAEMRIHAGCKAFFAIFAHDIGGERNDGQPSSRRGFARTRECAASR